MSVVIKGILGDPIQGVFANTIIRVTALINSTEITEGSEAEYITDEFGQYNFTLVTGLFLIELLYEDSYIEAGNILVNAASPNPATLSEAINYSTPVTVPAVNGLTPDWQLLFNTLAGSTDTEHTDLDTQIRDGDTYIANQLGLETNDRLSAESSKRVSTQDADDHASIITESYTYSDINKNQAVNISNIRETDDASSNAETQINQGSDGSHNVVTSVDTTLPDFNNLKRSSSTSSNGDITHSELMTITTPVARYSNGLAAGTSSYGSSSTSAEMVESTSTEDPFRSFSTTSTRVLHGYVDDDSAIVSKPLNSLVTNQNIEAVINGFIGRDSEIVVDADDNTSISISYIQQVGIKASSVAHTNDGVSTATIVNVDVQKFTDGEEDLMVIDTVNNTVTITGTLNLNGSTQDDLQGEAGDTIFDVYQYSPTDDPDDKYWHSEFLTGDNFRRTALSTNGVLGPWSTPARLSAEDGAPGDSQYINYRYADEQYGNYHDEPMLDGDKWRIEQLVFNGVSGVWSEPARITGADGIDGMSESIEYEYSIDGLGLWHSNYSSGDYWRRERIAYTDPDGLVTYGSWTQYKLIPQAGSEYFDGLNQATLTLYKRAPTTADVPEGPIGDLTYTFITGGLDGNLNGWTQAVPPGSSDVIFIASAIAIGSDTTDIVADTEWNIALLASAGSSGVDGLTPRSVFISTDVAPSQPSGTAIPPTGWSEIMPVEIPDGETVWTSITYAANSATSIGNGIWTTAGQVSGSTGAQGLRGKIARQVFYVSPTAPAQPTGVAIPPEGSWTAEPPVSVDLGDAIWTSITYADTQISTEGTGIWTDVSQWSGKDGINGKEGVYYSYVYRSSATVPAAPSTLSGSYDPNTDPSEIPPSLPDAWTDDPVFVEGEIVYVSYIRYEDARTEQERIDGVEQAWSKIGDWSTPTSYIIKGDKGNAGTDGDDGSFVSFIYKSIDPENQTIAAPVGGSYTGGNEDVPPDGWDDDPIFTDEYFTYQSQNRYVSTKDEFGTITWSQVGPWSEPFVIAKDVTAGVDGLDGSYVSYVYSLGATEVIPGPLQGTGTYGMVNGILTETMPSSPVGFAAWTDNPIYQEGKITFVAQNRYTQNADGLWSRGVWSAAAISAKKGDDGFVSIPVFLFKAVPNTTYSGVTPPSYDVTYKFASGQIDPTDDPGEGWSSVPPAVDPATSGIWTCQQIAQGSAADTEIELISAKWSTPEPRSGIKGANGDIGAGWYTYTSALVTSWPTTSVANQYFQLVAGRPPKTSDALTITNSVNFSETRLYEDGTWSSGVLNISGNVIVDGTLAAEKIVSGSISAQQIAGGTITGDKISSATAVTAGSGSNVAIISGADSKYRIWAGSQVPSASTPFSVDKYGKVRMSNAYVRGDIEADSLKANTVMVDTLNVRGRAITFPEYVSYSSRSVGTSWKTLGSFSVDDPKGGGYIITTTCTATLNDNTYYLRLLNSKGQQVRVTNIRYRVGGGYYVTGNSCLNLVYGVDGANGAEQYTIQGRCNRGSSTFANLMTVVMGGKR